MKLLVLKEQNINEFRVAITPDVITKYQKIGFEIYIESNCGIKSGFLNEDYQKHDVKIVENINKILPEIDLIISISRHDFDLNLIKEGAYFISVLNPFIQADKLKKFADYNINVFSLDLIPRITRSQSMDILSSQSNLAGYRAVIDAIYEMNKSVPMMITSAGTISASKFLIIGAGVAGLQAIATAKRMGAIVNAFDVRASAKEQVQSLGAKFIEVKTAEKYDGVYATEMTEDYKNKQQELLEDAIKNHDVIITTALIPGKKAPILITKKMVDTMKPNSIIIDLAVSNGGNCELTKANEIFIYENKIKIIGYENYPSRLPVDASKFFAKNLINFIELLINIDNKKMTINFNDEILKSTLIYSKQINKI